MKKTITLFLLVCAISLGHSQGKFLISGGSETYTSLASPECRVDVKDEFEFRDLGFDFVLGTDTINRLNFTYEFISNILIGSNGEFNTTASLFYPWLMEESPALEYNPEASYGYYFKVEGEEGQRIAIVEFQNIPIAEDGSTTNYQIWLHEKNNQLDYRYGKTDVKDEMIFATDTLRIGFMGSINLDGTESSNTYGITGSLDAPTLTPFVLDAEGVGIPASDERPKNNTVFKITYEKDTSVDNPVSSGLITLYPNPAQSIVSLTSGENEVIHKATIHTLDGRRIKAIHDNFSSINVEGLSKGIYLIQVNTHNGTITKKLLIN